MNRKSHSNITMYTCLSLSSCLCFSFSVLFSPYITSPSLSFCFCFLFLLLYLLCLFRVLTLLSVFLSAFSSPLSSDSPLFISRCLCILSVSLSPSDKTFVHFCSI